jgi:hypothetical protein
MRKLKNIALVILIVITLIGGGAMGYLWYSTKQQVDQIVAAAKPFAEISYGGIAVSPTGSVGVNQLQIMPNFVNDAVSIGAIRINAPNLLALFKIRWQLSQNQLPGALSISFQEVELPLAGGLLGDKAANSAAQRSPLDHLDALGCGPITTFGGAELQEMGYNRFIGNGEVGYRLDAAHNLLEWRIDSNTRDWMTLNLDIGFAMPAPPTTLMDLAALATPKLAKLKIVIRDDGFNQRRNNYCAAKAGKPINDYLADHVRLVVERLRANGINPGPGLIAAYLLYLREGGELTLAATPAAAINPAELLDYKPADVIKLLGLTLKVNNTAITDLTVDWDAAKVAKALGAEPESVEEDAPAPVVLEKPVIIQKSFHSILVSDLGQHIGKVVKLKTNTGVNYRGQVDAMVEGIVRITIRKSGGSMTLSLRAGEITSAEVLY